jgi:hypothetical protein
VAILRNPVPPRTVAVLSAADGQKLMRDLAETMDALLVIVEEETALVRAGRVDQSAALEPQKSALASRYLAACEKLKAHGKTLAAQWPQEIAALKRRHEMFQPLLKINLTVLATAHAVSEGIIRGVAGELTRKAAPQTYGMSGRATAPAPSAARPVSVSRTL